MSGQALLTGRIVGDRMELAGSGHWTADNAGALEALVEDASAGQIPGR